MKYEPTRESVSSHEAPQWFKDAKFGIFVHWGLFSVPGWAVKKGDGESVADNDEGVSMEQQMKYHPYAEWYLNSLRCPCGATCDRAQASVGRVRHR